MKRLFKALIKLLAVAVVLLVVWSLFFMVLYYTREISYYGLDRQALFDIFWWRKEALLEALGVGGS